VGRNRYQGNSRRRGVETDGVDECPSSLIGADPIQVISITCTVATPYVDQVRHVL
jgi:hypothetical protein